MRLLMLLVLLCTACPVIAGPFEDAKAAFDKGDYATALGLYQTLAKKGEARAQTELGLMYFEGYGVARAEAAAAIWFRMAAEQGAALAQNALAALYAQGRGVPQDYATAMSWYRKAADQGFAPALYGLGLLYFERLSMSQDYVQAHKWFNLAAERASDSEKKLRDLAIEKRSELTNRMTAAQIAAAQKLASEWKPKTEAPPPWWKIW